MRQLLPRNRAPRSAMIPILGLLLLIAGCGDEAATTSSDGGGTSSTTTSDTGGDTSVDTASDAGGGADSAGSATADSAGSTTEGPDTATTADTTAQDPVSADTATGSGQTAAGSSGATGTFAGKIVFDGTAPKLPPLITGGDAAIKDNETCAAHDVPDESLVVSADGNGVANVFVFMRRAPKGYKAPAPTGTVIIDQKNCRFLPHASVARVGQVVRVLSDDPVQHNVHTFPTRNKGINVLSAANDREGLLVNYRLPEAEPFQIKCDIHSWMSAYQVVVDHPFATVTGPDGTFRVEGLPAGKHEFRIWHEKAEFLERKLEIEIKAGETTERELKFAAERFAGVDVPVKTLVVTRSAR